MSSLAFLSGAIADSNAQLPEAFPEQPAASHIMQTGVPRRMVTVRQVSSVVHGNIHGTSFQQVQIDGWFILVNKKHRPMLRTNDTVVFFELESWIPADAPVLHGNLKKELRNPAKVNNVDGWRVSTWFTENNRQSKLMSEGFAVQIKHIPVVHAAYEADRVAAIRNGLRGNALEDHMRTIDYSQLLGVVKYEDQQPRSPNHKVPSFVIGTTINRYQNCDKMNLFQKKYHIAPKYTYQQTTKLDGSSMTVYFVNRKSKLYTALPKLEETDDNYKQHAVFSNGRFGVCSKNCDIARSTSDPNARPFFDTATRLAVNVTLHRLGESIGVQGELVGKQRAGNPYGYAQGSHDFFVYSVFDVDTRARWCPRRVAAFAQEHGLKHVPIRGEVIIPEIARSYAELQALADRLEESEGLVFRRVSDPSKCFKVLNKNWDAVKLAGRARIVGAVVAGPVGVPTQPDAAASRGEDGPGADAPRGNNKAGAVANLRASTIAPSDHSWLFAGASEDAILTKSAPPASPEAAAVEALVASSTTSAPSLVEDLATNTDGETGFLDFVEEITAEEALEAKAGKPQQWLLQEGWTVETCPRWYKFKVADLIAWLEREDGAETEDEVEDEHAIDAAIPNKIKKRLIPSLIPLPTTSNNQN